MAAKDEDDSSSSSPDGEDPFQLDAQVQASGASNDQCQAQQQGINGYVLWESEDKVTIFDNRRKFNAKMNKNIKKHTKAAKQAKIKYETMELCTKTGRPFYLPQDTELKARWDNSDINDPASHAYFIEQHCPAPKTQPADMDEFTNM